MGLAGQVGGLLGVHAEDAADLARVQAVPQHEVQRLALAPAQPGQGAVDEAPRLLPPGLLRLVQEAVLDLGRLVALGGTVRVAQPPHALVADERVQPAAEPVGLAQDGHVRVGGDERVVERAGRQVLVAQQRVAVVVQAGRVAVHDLDEGAWVARRQRPGQALIVGAIETGPTGHEVLPRAVRNPRPHHRGRAEKS
ncbi:hypothetical protein LUX32_17380 [Actinomadura madurae]|nr:hypothetical protein [Actinomadura madurae]MCP9979166.1 hypothetical protein [Actinomadura madurae]